MMFALFAALYALTASRGAQWQDAGHHIIRIMQGELLNPLGLALSHPLHYWLGRAALKLTFLEPAYAITLISALAGAAAVANIFGCVTMLTNRASAGVVAACSLGLANTFWQMATLGECNTLTTALLAGELWAVTSFLKNGKPISLHAAFLFNGLGIANHMLASLTTPLLVIVLILAIRRRDISWRSACGAPILWILGSLPYSGLVLLTLARSGDWSGTIRSALFGSAYTDAVLNVIPSWRQVAVVTGFLLLNFPNMTLPLFLRGLIGRKSETTSRGIRRYLLAALAIHALFALRYDVVDQHTFFLPSYVLLAVGAGLGFARVVMNAPPHRQRFIGTTTMALLLLTPAVYAVFTPLARRAGVLEGVAHAKPYRDDYVYLFIPWTVVDRSAPRVGREAVALAEGQGLIIIEDAMARPAVIYEQMRRNAAQLEITLKRPGATLDAESVVEAFDRGRRIVLVPLDRNEPGVITPLGSWERKGDLYVLRPE